MPDDNRPRMATGRMPIHVLLSSVPIVCFTGALLTDIAYSRSANMQWSNFSAWLLAFGLLFGALAVLFALIEHFIARPAGRNAGWVHGAGSVVALVLALFNSFVHARDGWTSVVPTGLTLSVITVVVIAVTAVLGHMSGPRYSEVQP
jgi:uncharacterized membrane protein